MSKAVVFSDERWPKGTVGYIRSFLSQFIEEVEDYYVSE